MQKSKITTHSIDPDIQEFISATLAGGDGVEAPESTSLARRRELAEEARRPWAAGGPKAACEDLTVPSEEGEVRIRILRPGHVKNKSAALVYLHGGGFTLFSLDTHDRVMREFAYRAGVTVIGVDYSLSPEAKFPTALNETVSVIDWLTVNGEGLGIDSHKLAMGGDSAGANLCVAACLKLRDRDEKSPIQALILNYGFFGLDSSTPSHENYGGAGSMLTTQELEVYRQNYVGGTSYEADPYAFPLAASLENLPPSYHVIPGCDPLADSNLSMVEKLILMGNEVEFSLYETASHSFLEAVAVSKMADEAFQGASNWLNKKLNY